MEDKKYQKFIKKLDAAFKNGNYQKAINISTKLLKNKDKDNLAIYSTKSTALAKLKRFSEAIDVIDEALKIYPDDPTLTSSRATFLVSIDEDEALREFDRVLELIGENDDAVRINTLYNKASVLKNSGIYEESLKSFNQLLEITPDDLEALEEKVDILSKLKRYTEGIKTCDKILNLDHSNMKAIINKSGMLDKIGKTQLAYETLEKLRKYGYSENLITLNKGIILMNNGKYDESFNYFTKLLKDDPNDLWALHYMARLYKEKGEYETSLEYHEKILTDSEDMAMVLNTFFHKALVLNKLERYKEALDCFNDLEEFPEFKLLVEDGKKEALDGINKS